MPAARLYDAHPLAFRHLDWDGQRKYAFVLGPGLVRDELESLVDAALRHWRGKAAEAGEAGQ